MEFKWIIIFLALCNLIISILLLTKKKKVDSSVSASSVSASPVSASPVSASPVSASPVSVSPDINPCALGCITYLAKNKVCSIDDVKNITEKKEITDPKCSFALAACASAYCCSPFCSENQQKCGKPDDSNPTANTIDAIYDLSYYFPL